MAFSLTVQAWPLPCEVAFLAIACMMSSQSPSLYLLLFYSKILNTTRCTVSLCMACRSPYNRNTVTFYPFPLQWWSPPLNSLSHTVGLVDDDGRKEEYCVHENNLGHRENEEGHRLFEASSPVSDETMVIPSAPLPVFRWTCHFTTAPSLISQQGHDSHPGLCDFMRLRCTLDQAEPRKMSAPLNQGPLDLQTRSLYTLMYLVTKDTAWKFKP